MRLFRWADGVLVESPTLEPGESALQCLRIAFDDKAGVHFEITRLDPLAPRDGGQPVLEMIATAVLGIIRFHEGAVLVVAITATPVGRAPGAAVLHRIDTVEFIPINNSESLDKSTTQELELMRNVLESRSFYFAIGYEVTHTLQRAHTLNARAPLRHTSEAWTRADERFFWNHHMLTAFTDARETLPGIDMWVTPIINGFVCCKSITFGEGAPAAELLLISRRSRHRQGTRFHRRGIDASSNVANFVETEQVIMHPDGRVQSMVQVRGSIPVYWSQEPTLKYTPSCTLHPGVTEEHSNMACAGHMRALNEVYEGPVLAVNLIDMKGDQRMLGEAYRAAVTRSATAGADVEFVWFDFHQECRGMRYERLSSLLDRISAQMTAIGYFERDGAGLVVRSQRGVIRTNCMDNLDRTNVVQSLFGRWMMVQCIRLRPVSVLDSGSAELEAVFKGMWADNADVMSILYSGTGALKTDFTRTGRRTIRGAVRDGVNSVSRYFINNVPVVSRKRQTIWDTVLGHRRASPLTAHTPVRSIVSPKTRGRLACGPWIRPRATVLPFDEELNGVGKPRVSIMAVQPRLVAVRANPVNRGGAYVV